MKILKVNFCMYLDRVVSDVPLNLDFNHEITSVSKFESIPRAHVAFTFIHLLLFGTRFQDR